MKATALFSLNTSHPTLKTAAFAAAVATTLLATTNVLAVPKVPIAYPDTAQTSENTAVVIDVLANDRNLTGNISITISGGPGHGVVTVNPDKTVLYSPAAGFVGQDGFTYTVSANNREATTASASIDVQTSSGTVPIDRVVTVSWLPPTSGAAVDGYRVYFGTSSTTATRQQSDIPVGEAGFDPQLPSVTYGSVADLGLSAAGDAACFRVTAYNSVGESTPSPTVCGTL